MASRSVPDGSWLCCPRSTISRSNIASCGPGTPGHSNCFVVRGSRRLRLKRLGQVGSLGPRQIDEAPRRGARVDKIEDAGTGP